MLFFVSYFENKLFEIFKILKLVSKQTTFCLKVSDASVETTTDIKLLRAKMASFVQHSLIDISYASLFSVAVAATYAEFLIESIMTFNLCN